MTQPPIIGFLDSLTRMQFSPQTPFIALKFVLLLMMTMYALFALVMIRQIDLMTKTIETPYTGIIKMVGYIHMIAALAIWFIVFTVL